MKIIKKKAKRNWYCYICGKKIGDDIVLISPSNSTDRVFLCHLNKICIGRVDRLNSYFMQVIANEAYSF